MPVYRLAPIDIRVNDEKWAASNLKEAVWVEAADELAARHSVEAATLKMVDFRPGQKLIFSPWLDDVVTSCQVDVDVSAPPAGQLITGSGKAIKI
ncbi:hypothetical protein [Bradyrhizobium diazoefficiens]|uniref:hypothetical protein n=1 Tax=Bradyrhizobium diazoefficiens TaxID=1355477 RepID=UPI00272A657C|nr:hypothetical protein [Bradyrhizobium diazoefficiens]WLA57209.1 hypothetical protein QIH81_00255 [Bradyrhizobium diazoefficiens]